MLWRFAQIACLALLAFGLAACKRNPSASPGAVGPSEQFLSLMNAGKNYLDQRDLTNALITYKKAAALVPNDSDVRMNLAITHLRFGAAEEAIREADELLKIDPNSAAAYFIKGSAYLRLSNVEEATKALENAKKIDPGETATFFQLGLARMGLKQWDAAIASFREGIGMDPNRIHAAPHYLLGQALLRAGRQEEANEELRLHQTTIDEGAGGINAATFERSKFTQPRVPFKLDQPDANGIKVTFVDATEKAFGNAPRSFSGPITVIDPNHSGKNNLFVVEKGVGFRMLSNSNGVFEASGPTYPAQPDATYYQMLVGDLQNDRADDIIVLGSKGSHLFRFTTNGVATDVSAPSGISAVSASDGILMDLDFTGKLDLVLVTAGTNDVRLYRQLGPLAFNDVTSTSGLPATLRDARAVTMADWNRDGVMDVIASREKGPPLLLDKQRGGAVVVREPTNWVAGAVIAAGDFDNDLRSDLAIVGDGKITLCFNSGEQKQIPCEGTARIRGIVAVDYDNDGWLDVWVIGDKIRAWRNRGLGGFQEQTKQLGLDKLEGGVSEIRFADFDRDCDPDAIVALSNGGLRYFRNDGGNDNSQVKVQLFGNRSNASGIGGKVEIAAGGLRLIRTVHELPVEIGVGKHQKLDSFLVHWFNWPQGSPDVAVSCKNPIFALEQTIQEGSCPYVYALNGERFEFITDILGAAPLGLPVASGRYIEADPEEYVWIGNEETFRPKDGNYQIRITEELREVLYLDEVKLVVVDHTPGSETHATDKLLPEKPFPPGELVTLHNERPLIHAEMDGRDVTASLKAVDEKRVSPPKLRGPQLRGIAEPYTLTLDFGNLNLTKPLSLVINGWLRFGGGMANIAASHDPTLPFPFPFLEAEVTPRAWKQVDVVVGAPAGKTKTIIVDLEGKLPAGTRRLRITGAFEIHYDRIALMEKLPKPATKVTVVQASAADLHFRGFSKIKDLPHAFPLTPEYNSVSTNGYWTIIPGGWCTRYGDVAELLASRDEGLALINSGDELTVTFAAAALPEKPVGFIREFFIYIDGWDKDSDFHVAAGATVEPLPFHGMNDQEYGREHRPTFPSDALHRKYNTRWVESRALKQIVER
ncbi:MAG TPA: FG-GAP-like repeat-containing protein [Pyrinomonadaceae bacterium]|nr:FG-GAP-like repeat-containing protein [Pyrinomonadaceae bacterium]